VPTVKEAKHRLTGIEGHVAVAIWSREDVIGRAKEKGITLTDKETDEILDDIDRHHDATLGITWDTIDCAIDDWKERCPACKMPKYLCHCQPIEG